MIWTAAQKARVRHLWEVDGLRVNAIAKVMSTELGVPVRRGMIAGLRTRLNLHSPASGDPVGLPSHHPAVIGARTLFPGQVRDPGHLRRRPYGQQHGGFVLAPGANQQKLGGMITKGAWSGMPMFSLSLEERATCPRTCGNWGLCYGNGMPMAVRYRAGPLLEERLEHELIELQTLYPAGFVVRLHLLGDFYSAQYAALWGRWLTEFPALRVFGYTAWPPDSEIGSVVRALSRRDWTRFAVRFSAPEPGPDGRAITLRKNPSNSAEFRHGLTAAGVIVCPAQTNAARSCGACGLCWAPAAMHKTIGFLAHGR